MRGLIGKKIGMTQVFNSEGQSVPVTVIEAGPCVVTQVKTQKMMVMKLFKLAMVFAKINILTSHWMGILKKQIPKQKDF